MKATLKSILILTCVLLSINNLKAATLFFNNIYQATGTYTVSTTNYTTISLISGTNFAFQSANPSDITFSGNDVPGILSYNNASGTLVQLYGRVSRNAKSGSTIQAVNFLTTDITYTTYSGVGYLLVAQGEESAFTSGSSYNTNSSPISADLNTLLSSQNTPPTITNISSIGLCQNTTSSAIAFTIGDQVTPASNLIVTSASSNTTLLPGSGMVLGGSGANRTITLTPATGQTGTAIVTISVSDASNSTTTTSFTLTVSLPKFNGSSGTVNAANTGTPVFVDNAIVVNETNTINGAKVTIISNFNTNDVLSVSTTLPTGVTTSYNASSGVLTINGSISPTDLQTLLRGVRFSSTSSVSGIRTVVFSLGTAIPYTNNHYYEYVSVPAQINWTNAKSAAAARSYYGLQGYLITVSDVNENTFIFSKITDDAWIGASDDYLQINSSTGTTTYANQVAAEGQWYWVTGPEAGQRFSSGNNSPLTQSGMYANWATSEPNNHGSTEHYGLCLYSSNLGKWGDLTNSLLPGYIVEYGGMPNDGCTNLSSTRLVSVATNQPPTISAVSNVTQCSGVFNSVSTTLTDDITPAGSLVLAASSSNTTLIPNSAISISGSGTGTRTISFTPVLAQSGTATITLTCTDGNSASTTTTFTVTVNQTPSLSSALTPSSVCNNGTFAYTPTSSLSGTSFSWIRPTISGITQTSTSGTSAISETLTNTSTLALSVPYTINLSNTNGCLNTQIVTTTVNPTPVLSSSLNPSAVASGATFNYTVTGSVGATFSWTRASVVGISNASGSGTGNISESLINTTTAPITVSYVYTISIGSCTNTQTINVVVNPTPLFTSSLTPPAICSGTNFVYAPSSATTGTTYSWSRAAVAGISNIAAMGIGTANENLVNTTVNPINVTYVYTLTANGVSNTQSVVVTVNPTPSLNSTLTPASICNNGTFAYTPSSATTGASFSWSRAAVSGISNTAGTGTGAISESLTNTTANTLNVIYAVTASANGCNGSAQNVTVPVQPTPTLSTSLTATAGSGNPFNYIPNSATTNITAAGWSRAVVAGISNAAASSASGIINETLINTTVDPVVVSYVYTLAIGSCINTQTVNVTVNPRPTLTSGLTATAVNNTPFTYTPTSATTGTTYSWSRAVVAGISNAAATGTGSINETLINTTANPINATYVITLTANGVTNIQNVVVTVYPTPTLSSSLTPSAVCSGATFNYTPTSATTGTTYSWSRAAVAGISNTAATGIGNITESLMNTTLTPITVNYDITLTANGVNNTQSIAVVINPMPTLTSGLTVNALCNVSPLFYIASSGTPGTTFAWSRASISGIANAAATGAGNIIETLNNTSADPITVNYVYTSTANGCSNPQTVSVVIKPTPTLSSTQTAAPVCNNTLFNYTATSATAGTTFTWSRAAVTGISNAATTGTGASISETLVNTSSSPRTVTYVYTLTANNCTNTQNVTVVVNPTALISSSLTPSSICTNTNFAYTPTSATVGTTFDWSRAAIAGISNSAATGSGAISETLINTTANPITVNYVFTLTSNACTNTSSQTVAVIVKPTPVLSSTLTPAAQCNGQSFNYTATSATLGTTYTWSRAAVAGITPATGSGNSSFILENLVNNTANPLTVNYVVNLNANGCTNTQNFSLTINSTPVLSSTLNAAPICNATTFAYTPSSNTTGTTYTWSRAAVAGISNAATTGIGDINETLNNTTQTPLIVSYVYTLTANGCTNTQIVKVTVTPTPVLTSSLTRSTCDNTVFNYTPTSATAGTTYTWSRAAVAGISNASASGTGVISETLLNTTNTAVTTTYILTLTANGCSNTQSVDVTVNPTPQISSSLITTPICSNTNFTYTPSSTVAGTSYAWTRATVVGISNAAGTGFGSINEALINTTPNPVTVNYVYVLSANNCSNIQNFNVTVNPSPVLTSTLTPTGVCSNTPFAYTPTSATAGTTYSWSRAAVAGISNASANGTGTINETLVNTTSAIAAPKYLITLTANGCSNSQFVQAAIFPTPTLGSGLTIAPVCSGVETNYIPASATSGTTYSWSRAAVAGISNAAATGTGNIKETLTNTSASPVNVNYVYTLTANTCTNTQTVATTINPKPATPVITALGPTTFCVEESVDLQVAAVSGGNYNWYYNGTNLGVNANTATVNLEGDYTATVTNTYGCTSATSAAVSITTPCSAGFAGMPTVFTPNGDGENDMVYAVIPGIKELKNFSIYNRWGNKVFDTQVLGTGWDGKFKDLEQPADVYFWYVEGVDSKGNTLKKQGKITLAR